MTQATYRCPHCGSKWLKPPKRERRKSTWRRFGRSNRRRVQAYKCCFAQKGVAR